MKLRITLPTAVVAEFDDVLHVRAEDASGAFGILPRHADLLTVLATCQQHQQNAFAYLTACCRAYFQTVVPPALIPQPG